MQPKVDDKVTEKKVLLKPYQRITYITKYCISGKCSEFCQGFIGGTQKDIYEKKDLHINKYYQIVTDSKMFSNDSIVMVQFDFLSRYLSNCFSEQYGRKKLDRKTIATYQRKFGQKLILADLFKSSLPKKEIDAGYVRLKIADDIIDTSLDLAFHSKLDPNDGYIYYYFDNYPQIEYSRRCSGDCQSQHREWVKANALFVKEEPFIKR